MLQSFSPKSKRMLSWHGSTQKQNGLYFRLAGYNLGVILSSYLSYLKGGEPKPTGMVAEPLPPILSAVCRCSSKMSLTFSQVVGPHGCF